MTLEPLTKTFDDRLQEIDAYLDLLDAMERQVHDGPPKIGGEPITVQQQRILYSSVYLQLYNLVEATATWCIEGVATAAAKDGCWMPGDLSDELRREWVRDIARTDTNLNYDKRLNTTMELFEKLIEARPIENWTIKKGGGGNWDDMGLEAIAERLGCKMYINPDVQKEIKQTLRDDKTPLKLIKHLRNKLAHGAMSFTECGENVTVFELRQIKDKAAMYLREVVDHFQRFIDNYHYLLPAKRPVGDTTE